MVCHGHSWSIMVCHGLSRSQWVLFPYFLDNFTKFSKNSQSGNILWFYKATQYRDDKGFWLRWLHEKNKCGHQGPHPNVKNHTFLHGAPRPTVKKPHFVHGAPVQRGKSVWGVPSFKPKGPKVCEVCKVLNPKSQNCVRCAKFWIQRAKSVWGVPSFESKEPKVCEVCQVVSPRAQWILFLIFWTISQNFRKIFNLATFCDFTKQLNTGTTRVFG